MSILKPTKGEPKPRRPRAPKPPSGKLSPAVCPECERDILFGYSAGIPVRIEPTLVTTAAEPTLWALGQPTYAVHRGDQVTLSLRMPSPAAQPVDEVAIAHICDSSSLWMSWTQRCPQWFGFSKYVVAQIDGAHRVLRADEIEMVYREVLSCGSLESAVHTVQALAWRDRARALR